MYCTDFSPTRVCWSAPPPASTARPRSHPQGPRHVVHLELERETGYSSLDTMKMIYFKLIQCSSQLQTHLNYRATATALQQQNQEYFPTTNTPAHLQLSSQAQIKLKYCRYSAHSRIETCGRASVKYAANVIYRFFRSLQMSTNVICVLVQQFSVFDDSVSSRSTSAYYCFQAVTPKSAPVVIDLWTGVPISWLLTLTAFISLFSIIVS